MIALGKCNVISLNVRGLRNRLKRRSMMKIFGKVNGEVTCSFHMDQHTVKVFASY